MDITGQQSAHPGLFCPNCTPMAVGAVLTGAAAPSAQQAATIAQLRGLFAAGGSSHPLLGPSAYDVDDDGVATSHALGRWARRAVWPWGWGLHRMR